MTLDSLRLEDGTLVEFRPIRPDDEDRLERLFYRLSPRTVYLRFFSPIHVPPRGALHRFANVDHTNREAIVATVGDEVVGVARFDRIEDGTRAELAILVEDAYQGRGLGRALVDRLTRAALDRQVDAFVASMLPENRRAVGMVRGRGDVRFERDGGVVAAVIPLRAT